MQYRPLGRSGVLVSPVGLGCGPIMSLTIEEGTRLVGRAVELGINYIDTARSYGQTEIMVGRALRGQRDKVFLSTKTDVRTRAEAWRQIQESLERLQTDHVDNVHLHGLVPGEDIDARFGPGGALEALIEARDKGLTRHIGCTSHYSRALITALERYRFDVILVPMNLVEREPMDALIPLCHREGVGVTIMKPVATGFLPATLALKWLANQPIACAVPGATTVAEVEEDAAVNHLDDVTLTLGEEMQVEALADGWAQRRCRLCTECLPCPQEISIDSVLGTDVMHTHYRIMGPAGFAGAPWAREQMERDLAHREALVAKIETCPTCRQCDGRCPHGLPIVEMLQRTLPTMRDMVAIYRQRLG